MRLRDKKPFLDFGLILCVPEGETFRIEFEDTVPVRYLVWNGEYWEANESYKQWWRKYYARLG